MKLLLASKSDFLIKEGYRALGFLPEQTKIGYVVTASKVARNKSFIEFLESYREQMTKCGYNFREIDIVAQSSNEVRELLKDINILHVEGGNTFYLLKTIKDTGFDKVIRELLARGVVYVGTSAGAYVMCPTIEVADWDKTGKDRFGLTDFSALNYVPFAIKAHYTDEQEEEVRKEMQNLKYPLRILRNEQGFLVEDNQITLIGEGDEVKLD